MTASPMVIGLEATISDPLEATEIIEDRIGPGAQNIQSIGLGMFSFEMDTVAADSVLMQSLSGHEFVERDERYQLDSVNDPLAKDLWGLHRVDAPDAWLDATGDGVTVAVIDTGIDLTHPDLQENLWSNSGEVAGNGLDDDGNGFVDDVFGYDFRNRDSDPQDDAGHGTHVGGTIAAAANNGIGVAGVAPDASLMAIKTMGRTGGLVSETAAGIVYATNNGADVINLSLSGARTTAMVRAIDYAIANGVVVIASAGNNSRLGANFPASHPDVISVASTTQSDSLSYFSNYGIDVDIAAPGSGILSSMPGGQYGYASGTSMAAPHVAGAAALVVQQNPGITPVEVRERLMSSADQADSLKGKIPDGRILNAAAALDPSSRRPTTRIDSAAVIRNGTAIVDPLANDSDPNGHSLTLESAESTVAGATISIEGNTLSYTAGVGFEGTDFVRYTVRNAVGRTASGVVRVEVMPMEMVNRRLVITGTAFDDEILVTQSGRNFSATMNGTTVSLPGGIRKIYVDAGPGDDTVRMDVSIPTTLFGRKGNDILIGGSSRDRIYGGHNDDQIFGRQGADAIYAGSGKNTVRTGKGHDEVYIVNQNSNSTIDGRRIRWYERRGFRDWLFT